MRALSTGTRHQGTAVAAADIVLEPFSNKTRDQINTSLAIRLRDHDVELRDQHGRIQGCQDA